MKLLVIEDEKALAADIKAYLEGDAWECEVVHNYADAHYRLGLYDYDCVVVDLTLPDGNGLTLIEELKKKRSDTGIIIISARNSLDDKIQGLELGSDDYITKPFHLSELNARIDALMRRRQSNGQREWVVGDLTIFREERKMKVNERDLDLTHKEYDLLLYLITNRNRVLTKEALAEYLWGDEVDFADSLDFIYAHIKNIRKKIAALGGHDSIQTRYGVGYQFKAP